MAVIVFLEQAFHPLCHSVSPVKTPIFQGVDNQVATEPTLRLLKTSIMKSRVAQALAAYTSFWYTKPTQYTKRRAAKV
jgi:sRNA-binding protein